MKLATDTEYKKEISRMKEITRMINNDDDKIKQQEKVCHDTIYGKFGHRPVDYDCGCGLPDFTYDTETEQYDCNSCGEIISRDKYTNPVFLNWE